MADLAHERERLYRAVDSFLEAVGSHDYEELRLDTFGVVSIGTWVEEGVEVEAPFQWYESRRQHVQLGVLKTCLLDMESSYVGNE